MLSPFIGPLRNINIDYFDWLLFPFSRSFSIYNSPIWYAIELKIVTLALNTICSIPDLLNDKK